MSLSIYYIHSLHRHNSESFLSLTIVDMNGLLLATHYRDADINQITLTFRINILVLLYKFFQILL